MSKTKSPIKAYHFTDRDGNPAGGHTRGIGIAIRWQSRPMRRGKIRLRQNGAFIEDVLLAARNRLEWHQDSKFCCEENERAIEHIDLALQALNDRTKRRKAQGVEGTYEGA